MAKTKNEETIKIKKKTLILAIVVIIAILAALGSVYYMNTKKDKEKTTTEEVLPAEPIEVTATAIIAKECTVCINMSQVIQELKQTPLVVMRQSNILFASSREAKDLIRKYEIAKIPTLILQGEKIDELPLRGFKEIENTAILEDVPPPYVNLETKNLEGLVDITYVKDKSCEKCYEVEQHKVIMEMAFGLFIQNEETIDINSAKGAEILQKYDITKVPTILLSSEAAKYPAIQEVWEQIGTTEKDGTLVFRGFDMTQDIVYKDLSTGELINSSQIENEE
ncbi:hypothetical protein GF358_03830 [Candidatus Woesearchaeota archaeon]|nr:hypothetical protein [Candidatus Woesearchaeota archaeon]